MHNTAVRLMNLNKVKKGKLNFESVLKSVSKVLSPRL